MVFSLVNNGRSPVRSSGPPPWRSSSPSLVASVGPKPWIPWCPWVPWRREVTEKKAWKNGGNLGKLGENWRWNSEIPWDFRGKSWESEEKHETSIGFDTDLVNKNGGLWGNVHGFSWNGGLNICNRRITCINMCKQNNEEVFSKKISGSNMFQHINIRISILPSRKEHHGEKRGNITCNEDT